MRRKINLNLSLEYPFFKQSFGYGAQNPCPTSYKLHPMSNILSISVKLSPAQSCQLSDQGLQLRYLLLFPNSEATELRENKG